MTYVLLFLALFFAWSTGVTQTKSKHDGDSDLEQTTLFFVGLAFVFLCAVPVVLALTR